MRILAFVIAAVTVVAQTPPVNPTAPAAPGSTSSTALAGAQQVDGIREAMSPSLDKQRDSVRRQVRVAQPVNPGWYTVPWPSMQWTSPVPASESPPGLPGLATNAGWRPDCDPVPEPRREELFQNAADQHRVDVGLLREVARKESAFYPCAVSSKGALGLMQLMPGTAAAMGVADPFDPETNVLAGAQLLASLLGRYGGDRRLALAAYNAGPSRVEDYGGVPPFRETQNYVGKILEALGAGVVGASQ